MSEETIKRQRREIAEAVFERFKPFGFQREKMDGNPFDLRIYRFGCYQEWLIRCVSDISKRDQLLVQGNQRPGYCIKGIVFRPNPGSKLIQFQEIK